MKQKFDLIKELGEPKTAQ